MISWSTIWILWIAAFAVLETIAGVTGGRTLSQTIWSWTAGAWWKQLILGVFLGWLLLHLVWRV